MPGFTIIVPVFNRPGYTKACLDSVVGTSAEVIVVDNHSRGDVKGLLASYGDRIKVIRNKSNLGIARAMNQGLREASNDRVVMMHNDCVAPSNFEKAALACFDAMAGRFRLACPMTNYADESTFVLSKDLQQEFVAIKPSNKTDPSHGEVMSLVSRTYESRGGIDAVAEGVSGEIVLVGEVSSFCILASKSEVVRIGGFNEEFLYRGFEDKELCLRLGYDVGKAPFFVHHFGNITSDGPGFSFKEIKERNCEVFDRVRKEFLGETGGPIPWTAIVFPERNFPELAERAKAALREMNDPPSQVVEIPHPGIYPIKAAWDWVLPQVRHGVLGVIDADMIVNPDAATAMVGPFETKWMGMVAGALDDHSTGRMGHLVFWRTAALRTVMAQVPPAIDYEIHFQAAVKRAGMGIVWVDKVVGKHAPHLDPWSIFRAFFRRGIKQRIRGLGKSIAVDEIRGALERGGPWAHVALVGFHSGIRVDYAGDPHDEAFDAFTNEHYEPVRPFCEAIAASADIVEFLPQEPRDGRIRVALLCECLEIGGMEIIVSILDKLVDRSRFDVRIYSRVGGALESALKSKIRISGRPQGTLGRQVADWLLRDGIEVAVSMSFLGSADIFSRGKSCRFIERLDSATYGYVTEPGITDMAIFESETMFEMLSPTYPCKNKVIVPNGREPFSGTQEDRVRVRAALGLGDDDVLISNIARMDPCKNQRDQILMVAELVRRGSRNLMLVIMGPDRGVRRDLDALVVELGMDRWVKIKDGSVKEVAPLLAASDVAINTSPSEGLAGSLVEALHAGLPIVATDAGATRDIVSSANGALVKHGSVGVLADAIAPILASRSLRERMGKESLELAKGYSAERMVGGFERLVEEQGLLHRLERSNAPHVTVVVPVWNRHQFLGEAIRSVLAQDDPKWLMVVAIDDENPTPEVMAVLEAHRDPRISWVKSPHKNQCSALNHAMRYVKSEYASRLDSDDELAPDAIRRMKEQIGANRKAGFFYSERRYIDADGRDISEKYPGAGDAEDFSPQRLEEWYITRSLCTWRVSEFVRAGGFDEEITYGEDYLLPLTMMLRGTEFQPVKAPLYRYRMHGGGNVSAIPTPEQDAFVNAVRSRYQKLKRSLGVSWAGEDASTMMPRSWFPVAQAKKI